MGKMGVALQTYVMQTLHRGLFSTNPISPYRWGSLYEFLMLVQQCADKVKMNKQCGETNVNGNGFTSQH